MSSHVLQLCLLLLSSLIQGDPKIVGKIYKNETELESIGIEFIDVSGDLEKLVEYEVEVLADSFGFLEGPVFINDYLLFTEPKRENIWKYNIKENTIELWENWGDEVGGGCTGIAWTKSYPDELWISCMFAKKVLHVNLTTHSIIDVYDHKRYHPERDSAFQPNDIVVTDDGHVYFTDLPLDRKNEEGARGGVYHIDREGKGMTLIQLIGYGPNGLTLSNDQSMIVAANMVDVPIEEYDYADSTQFDWHNMFILGYTKKHDDMNGLLEMPFAYFSTDKEPYHGYMLHDKYDMLFDSNGFDKYGNLWQAVYFNFVPKSEGGQISILRNDGTKPEDVKYIGSIRERNYIYAASNLEMGGDGYMYATCGDLASDQGTLIRYKLKEIDINKQEL